MNKDIYPHSYNVESRIKLKLYKIMVNLIIDLNIVFIIFFENCLTFVSFKIDYQLIVIETLWDPISVEENETFYKGVETSP